MLFFLFLKKKKVLKYHTSILYCARCCCRACKICTIMNKAQKNTVATWKQNQAVGRDRVIGLKLEIRAVSYKHFQQCTKCCVRLHISIKCKERDERWGALLLSVHPPPCVESPVVVCPAGSVVPNCTTVCMKNCCISVQYIESYKYNSYGQSRIQILSKKKIKSPHRPFSTAGFRLKPWIELN